MLERHARRNTSRQVHRDVDVLRVVRDARSGARDLVADRETGDLVAELDDRPGRGVAGGKPGRELPAHALHRPQEPLILRDREDPLHVLRLLERAAVERHPREPHARELRADAHARVRDPHEDGASARGGRGNVFDDHTAAADEDLSHASIAIDSRSMKCLCQSAKLRTIHVGSPSRSSTRRSASRRSKMSVRAQNPSIARRAVPPSRSKSHSYTGTPNPCLGRSMSSSGMTPRTAFLRMYFSVPFRTFTSAGMLMASSTNLWSRKGTRPSRLTPIAILSTRMRRSSGRRRLRSA